MNRCIRDKREKLRRESTLLRESASDNKTIEESLKIREKQNSVYNKWKFYDSIIKASERVNSRNN